MPILVWDVLPPLSALTSAGMPAGSGRLLINAGRMPALICISECPKMILKYQNEASRQALARIFTTIGGNKKLA